MVNDEKHLLNIFKSEKIRCKRIIVVFLLIIFSFSQVGCREKNKENKQKQLSIYMDVKDKAAQNIIKLSVEEFLKQNSSIKISMNNSMGSKIEEDVSKGNAGDVIISDRVNTAKLEKKGLLIDLKQIYEKNKIMERYYTVVYNYARFDDKFYAIPIMPFTIEFAYNIETINKMNFKLPITKSDASELLISLNKKGIKVPVVLNDDIDVHEALSSFIINNVVDIRKLEANYDGGLAYKEVKDMQKALDTIKNLVKSGLVNNNIFELGNNNTIERFDKGEIPIIATTSYYVSEIKNPNIKIIDDYGSISNSNSNAPVYSNCLISLPTTSKNGEVAEEFIKFVYGDDFQKMLANKGFVTGNKNVNSQITGLGSSVVKHLANANENNIIYFQVMPERINRVLDMKLKDIYEGKLSKNEWEQAVEEAY